MFPKNLQESAINLMKKTEKNNSIIVNFAMGYGGCEEIIDATKKIAEKVRKGELKPEDIDEEMFEEYLYNPSKPDLIIRTSGEFRLSNFLNYQGAYSELFFVKKLWPEFEKADLVEVIQQFKERGRRFGG
jgi:undecaprenyl diphosphate synthase